MSAIQTLGRANVAGLHFLAAFQHTTAEDRALLAADLLAYGIACITPEGVRVDPCEPQRPGLLVASSTGWAVWAVQPTPEYIHEGILGGDRPVAFYDAAARAFGLKPCRCDECKATAYATPGIRHPECAGRWVEVGS